MTKKIDHKIFFSIYNFTVSHDLISKLAVFITKFSSKFFSVIYFAVGGWLIYSSDPRIKEFILIPSAFYLIVKLIPFLYNRRRPFIEYNLKSLIKQRDDHSFPSTHAGSSLIISLAVLNINFQFGILIIFLALLISFSRIMVGVHYFSDILGAWLIALSLHFLGIIFLI